MRAWMLVLYLGAWDAKNKQGEEPQVIEIKGFSTQEDCEKAADAAGAVFHIKQGPINSLVTDCKKE